MRAGSPDAPELSLLIVTTSQAASLVEALDALLRNLPSNLTRETIVVLSRATPEVKAVVAKRHEPLLVLDSPVNLGVAGGYNRARHAARGHLLALLHDDSRIEPGWFPPIAAALARHPDAGAVSSLVLDPGGSLQSAGSLLWREGWTTVPWPSGDPPPIESFDAVEPIDYGGTAATVVRSNVFDSVGGLDERLHPGYYVDVDLCLAIRSVGRTVLLAPESRVVHRRGSSTSSGFREFLTLRNRQRILNKWPETLSLRPAVDLTPAGIAAARERVREEAGALARAFAKSPARRLRRFALDPDAQQLRLGRLDDEVLAAYEAWERRRRETEPPAVTNP